jgi:hypothetical protein
VFSNGTRFHAQACVEVGLPTTGLVGSEVHGDAEALENVHDRLARLWVERIDKAGDKKLHSGHVSIVSPNQQQVSKVCPKFGMIAPHE